MTITHKAIVAGPWTKEKELKRFRERKLEDPIKYRYKGVRERARKYKIPFTITLNDLRELEWPPAYQYSFSNYGTYWALMTES